MTARAPGVRTDAEVLERRFFGRRLLRFDRVRRADDLDAAVDALGHMPLPPYIQRPDTDADRERYQTVFATRARIDCGADRRAAFRRRTQSTRFARAGIGWTTITLHVGYGTFKPVRVDRVEDHAGRSRTVRHRRRRRARDRGRAHDAARRIIAVGTTTTRALETAADGRGGVRPATGSGRPLHPSRPPTSRSSTRCVTNFHLPRSSLLMLVAAFAGRDLMLAAYRHAIAERSTSTATATRW